MSEMIDRVARAIYDSEMQSGGGGHIALPYNVMKEKYLIKAHGAINAMREPTEAMLHAYDNENGCIRVSGHRTAQKLKGYQSMIDVALEDADLIAVGAGGMK